MYILRGSLPGCLFVIRGTQCILGEPRKEMDNEMETTYWVVISMGEIKWKRTWNMKWKGGLCGVCLVVHRGLGLHEIWFCVMCLGECIQGFSEVQASAHLGWTISRHHVGTGIVAICTKNMQTHARQENSHQINMQSVKSREKFAGMGISQC